MRVMKFISVAAIFLMVSALAVGQQAPAQGSTTLKHVPISKTPSTSGKQMCANYCAVCHGIDAKGKWTSRVRIEERDHRSYWPGETEQWKVSCRACGCGDSWARRDRFSWHAGHADLGAAVLQYRSGPPGPGAAEDQQPRFVHRDFTDEVALSENHAIEPRGAPKRAPGSIPHNR